MLQSYWTVISGSSVIQFTSISLYNCVKIFNTLQEFKIHMQCTAHFYLKLYLSLVWSNIPDSIPWCNITSLDAIRLSLKTQGKNNRQLMIPNSTLIHPAAVYMSRVSTPGISCIPLSPNGVTAAWSPANRWYKSYTGVETFIL